jgi:predicted secreted hydrolase
MENGAFQARPLGMADVAGRQVPTTWQVTLPAKSLDVTVRAINDAAWMATSVPYWEGPVIVSGSRQGRGYLEMTGY